MRRPDSRRGGPAALLPRYSESPVLDAVSRDELRALAGTVVGPCVSLFLPTHRAGPDSRSFAKADVIRFKNLLREAERKLRALGTPAPETRRLLAPARARLEDERFWRYQADGLALLSAATASGRSGFPGGCPSWS